jgi:hypothetical protein
VFIFTIHRSAFGLVCGLPPPDLLLQPRRSVRGILSALRAERYKPARYRHADDDEQ